jgi:ketosteroid isomerase-like protein
MTKLASCLAVLLLGTTALAQDKAAPPPGGMDHTKMGPMSRPVTKEDKKGVDATYKAMMDAMKAGDVNAAAELIDFPVIMLSDDSQGAPKHFSATREQWVGMMKPMLENMPKDIKMSHKHNTTFLSDTLAVAISDEGMQMGKVKGKWKSLSVLTQKDGKWKFKQMAEAGWGDIPLPSAAAANTPPRK